MSENTYSAGASTLIPISSRPIPNLAVPEPLQGLIGLATNLFWTWHPEVQDLFRRIDAPLWDAGAGPVRILLESKNVEAMAADDSFAADIRKAASAFENYMAGADTAWYSRQPVEVKGGPIAYFCAEYGLHESFNQYAGGLGILAGDHCKEASDMGLPFVAVGLFYRRGFFKQMIDWEGRQEHLYPVYAPETSSVERVLEPGTGKPLTIQVEMPGRTVAAVVWLASVGRVPLVLLDTDVPGNAVEDRAITSQLYNNTREMRLHQECILGVGGVRALRALGIHPSVWHLNEGHSAFLLLERLREYLADGKSATEARETVKSASIITIHTPVPEGNERFGSDLAASLVAPVVAGTDLSTREVLSLGLGADSDPNVFDMTAFALRHCRAANGVSLLHGRTADDTWRDIAGYRVGGVTNGVHMPSWIGPEMKSVFAACGGRFDTATEVSTIAGRDGRPVWDDVLKVDDRAFWEAHLAHKQALVEFAKRRLYAQFARHGEGPAFLHEVMDYLDPDAFFIGFARRFATYKRASLLFSDPDRLDAILNAPGRKVQLLFSGKSHPSDRGGQALISEVFGKAREPRFRGKVFLLEDYDIEVGRHLVQGADMWLNNPRRPLEASGTSGMKAAANGVPNVSILDGWWDEAYEGPDNRNGWAIGGREMNPNPVVQDRLDAEEVYRILEQDVIPAYFDRDASGLPTRWLKVMKRAVATSAAAFSTKRMLEDYLTQMLVVR